MSETTRKQSDFFGMNRGVIPVQDYLVEQVLSHQIPELRECLLKTSILDRFCAPLCEAICNGSPPTHPATEAVNGRKFMETITQAKLQDVLSIMSQAVGLAWPRRWILPFIEGGVPVAELLAQLPKNPEWGGFVSRILSRFNPEPRREVAQQTGARRRRRADR